MEIQENFLVLFRRNEICLTVINFAKANALIDIKADTTL